MNYRTHETNSERNESKSLNGGRQVPLVAAEISGKVVTKKLRISHLAWPTL